MKSLAELPLIGLIGTMTIMAGLVIPPTVVKLTADRELVYTYESENVQHALLALFSAEDNGKAVYETIGTNYILNQPTDSDIKKQFDDLLGKEYYITLIGEDTSSTTATTAYILTGQASAPSGGILSEKPIKASIVFNTVFVLPYNSESLVKVIRIGAT